MTIVDYKICIITRLFLLHTYIYNVYSIPHKCTNHSFVVPICVYITYYIIVLALIAEAVLRPFKPFLRYLLYRVSPTQSVFKMRSIPHRGAFCTHIIILKIIKPFENKFW